MPFLPLAANHTTGIAIVSLAVLVAGYGACFALWYFIFRRAPIESRAPTEAGEESPDASAS